MTGPGQESPFVEVIRRMEEQFSRESAAQQELHSADSPVELARVWQVPSEIPEKLYSYWGALHADPSESPTQAETRATPPAAYLWFDAIARYGAPAVTDARARRLAAKSLARTLSARVREFAVAGELPAADVTSATTIPDLLTGMLEAETADGANTDDASIRRLRLNLEYVWARLLMVYPERQSRIWLESYNFNVGTRPVDALRLGKAADVIRAVDIEEQGAFG